MNEKFTIFGTFYLAKKETLHQKEHTDLTFYFANKNQRLNQRLFRLCYSTPLKNSPKQTKQRSDRFKCNL